MLIIKLAQPPKFAQFCIVVFQINRRQTSVKLTFKKNSVKTELELNIFTTYILFVYGLQRSLDNLFTN